MFIKYNIQVKYLILTYIYSVSYFEGWKTQVLKEVLRKLYGRMSGELSGKLKYCVS
jgi:hypothetical protein